MSSYAMWIAPHSDVPIYPIYPLDSCQPVWKRLAMRETALLGGALLIAIPGSGGQIARYERAFVDIGVTISAGIGYVVKRHIFSPG